MILQAGPGFQRYSIDLKVRFQEREVNSCDLNALSGLKSRLLSSLLSLWPPLLSELQEPSHLWNGEDRWKRRI